MIKFSNRVTAVLVMAFMLTFMLFTALGGGRSDSRSENREPARLPDAGASELANGSFTEGLNTYLADHFAFRGKWVKLNARLRAELGEGLVNGVYIAGDRLLDTEYSSEHSVGEIAKDINRYAETYGSAVYFVAVPTSAGVYGDELPEYLNGTRESSTITSLYEKLDPSVRKIDAYNVLKMLNDNYIYYRSDTRWTVYGAYCVYRTVIQKLGFLPTTYDKYTIEHAAPDFRGNLYDRSQYTGVKPDILDFYKYQGGAEAVSCTGYYNDGTTAEKQIYDKAQLSSGDMYNAYLGEDVPFLKIKTSANNERKLLVFKDSYADCFIPFLIQHYSEIDVVTPELVEGGASRFVDPSDYEQTLFLFGIENLTRSGIPASVNK